MQRLILFCLSLDEGFEVLDRGRRGELVAQKLFSPQYRDSNMYATISMFSIQVKSLQVWLLSTNVLEAISVAVPKSFAKISVLDC